MRLDRCARSPTPSRSPTGSWRRYGRRAFDLLEAIRADPTMGEDVMGSADYLRAELHTAAEHEMIVKLDDFMRRRSKIDLVVHDDDIRQLARAARGRRDPVRRRRRPPARRVLRREGDDQLIADVGPDHSRGCRGPWSASPGSSPTSCSARELGLDVDHEVRRRHRVGADRTRRRRPRSPARSW